MKTGLTLEDLAAKLTEQNEAKRDFVVDTRELTFLPMDEGKAELHLPNGTGEFTLTGVAPRQIGSHLKVPARFWDMLATDHRDLLAHNVNTLFREKPARRMVRCFDFGDGRERTARAYLSDRYLRRDNYDVAQATLQALSRIDEVEIPSSQITDEFLHITALAPKVQGEVKAGDVVQAGVRIRNSEVGTGALTIEPITYRLWCSNGCGTWQKTRVFHLGSQLELNEESVRVLSDSTLELDDKAFFAKLADIIAGAVDEMKFQDFLAQMRLSTETEKMVKPQLAMEELGKRMGVTESEGDSILAHLIEGGDLTCYGALNAYTRAAQDVESYDRSMEMESMGGKILAMAGTADWTRVALTD